jgi:hypothetical protein
MPTIHPTLRRVAGLLSAGAVLAVSGARLAADEASSQADAFPTYESYIKVSGQAPIITGDSAAFANRTGTPSTGSAGIEDLYYTKDISDNDTVTIDGHALGGVDDYLASFKLENDKVGSVDTGYSRFRTFYDGIGGFFPLADQFERWSTEDLHVDRSSYWVDLKLALPDRPVFTISFHDDIRTGMKDSSEWSPIVNPLAVIAGGKVVGTTLPSNTPYIGPTVMNIDEHHDSLNASMTATAGNTTETLKATLNTVNNIDGHDYVKYPGSKVTAYPTVTVQDDLESRRTTNFRLSNETETKFNDQFAVDTGLSYSQLASANGGAWITPTYSSTANAVYIADTAANIFGGSHVYDYVGNISLDYTPTADWQAALAYRQEYDVNSSSGGYLNTSLATTAKTIAPVNITTKNELTYSHFDEHIGTPELSVQYRGVQNLDLYASFDDRINKAGQHWINPYAAVTTTGAGVVTLSGAPAASVFLQDANQDNQNIKVGANWNATALLTIRAEIYRKDDENKYIGSDAIAGTGSYGAFFANDYTFTGARISVILKPTSTLSLNTRYQPGSGMMAVTANATIGGNGDEVTSGRIRAQMLSETVNWTPNPSIYMQGNVDLVYSYIETAYPEVTVSSTTNVATPIQNANNNYVSGSGLCGFVIDKRTDAQLKYTWTRADDYNPQIALGGQPYGAGFTEQSATAGLKHLFNNRIQGELRGGYLRRVDQTTGGFTNYHGPLFYAAITYSL